MLCICQHFFFCGLHFSLKPVSAIMTRTRLGLHSCQSFFSSNALLVVFCSTFILPWKPPVPHWSKLHLFWSAWRMCLMPLTFCIVNWALSLRCRRFSLKPLPTSAYLQGIQSNAFTSLAREGIWFCCQPPFAQTSAANTRKSVYTDLIQHVQAVGACIYPSK